MATGRTISANFITAKDSKIISLCEKISNLITLNCSAIILYSYMIPNLIKIGKQILGSSLLLPAYGRVGQGQHSLAAHFAKATIGSNSPPNS